MTQVLNGTLVKDVLLKNVQAEIENLKKQTGKNPGLAVILVGDNAASKVYVGHKKKTCESIGITSFEYLLNSETSESELIAVIHQLNNDKTVHGILLQLPLPKHLDSDKMLQLISPEKDVDGFHPINVGKLLIGLDTFKSCTPYGVCELLKYYNIDTAGKHVVIIGRSNIVGKPLAAMLMQKSTPGNATVTVCHSQTPNIAEITKQADILIAAIGVPNYVKRDMIKSEAIVIDVGMNRIVDNENPTKSRLVGDVDYNDVFDKCAAITPVPGGIGPLTITMLMKNTLQSFKNNLKIT
jgi:methylenetetrahydrofolate dehydrogenase (NADP+)/methenyltetrahydrofolate cyclohydrolase